MAQPTSLPATASSISTFASYCRAVSIASGSSSRPRTLLTPKDEPERAEAAHARRVDPDGDRLVRPRRDVEQDLGEPRLQPECDRRPPEQRRPPDADLPVRCEDGADPGKGVGKGPKQSAIAQAGVRRRVDRVKKPLNFAFNKCR